MAQVQTSSTTTRTTAVVTEVPDERRWQGRDWVKTAIAGGLALALLRPGAQPVAQTQPTAAAVATPLPAVVSTVVPTVAATVVPTVAATVAATVVPTVAATAAAAVAPPAAAVEAPLPIFTREVIFAGPRTIQGTGTPGSTVEVLVNGAAVGTATVGADGRWQLDAALEAGTNEVVARAVDASGAVVAAGDPVQVAVEAAPAAVAAPTLDAPAGDLPGGPAVLTGTGAPGSTVRVRVGGVDAGTATVGADGRWALDAILAAGQQEIVVEAIDSAGAVVAAADPATVSVVGGLGVTLSEPAEGATLPAGPATVAGTGAPGTVLEILNGDQVLGEATVGADGTWSAEVPLAAGTSSISVREQGTDQVLSRPVRVQVGGGAGGATPCTEIAVGCQAWVTRQGGLVLRMRSAAAITPDNVVARLPIGTEMEVLEGPSAADGFTWWRVRTVGGNEGWVAGENLVPQPD